MTREQIREIRATLKVSPRQTIRKMKRFIKLRLEDIAGNLERIQTELIELEEINQELETHEGDNSDNG